MKSIIAAGLILGLAAPALAVDAAALAALRDTGSCAGCDLTKADLRWANVYGAELAGAPNLVGAVLDGAVLDGANLYGANLEAARLRGASLRGAEMSWTSLRGADLTGADLTGARLDGAIFCGTVYRITNGRRAPCIPHMPTLSSNVRPVMPSPSSASEMRPVSIVIALT